MRPTSREIPQDSDLDSRTKSGKRLKRFLKQDDAEQFDSIRENLSLLNYYLSTQALSIAKSGDSAGLRELVQICTAFGISYDKMYSKRDPGIRPLSFPEPLVKMVQRGLVLSNRVPAHQPSEVAPQVSEVAAPAEPAPPSRYKTQLLQRAHEQVCPSVPLAHKEKGVNPRAAYRREWERKRKEKAANDGRTGGEAWAGPAEQGGELSPSTVA